MAPCLLTKERMCEYTKSLGIVPVGFDYIQSNEAKAKKSRKGKNELNLAIFYSCVCVAIYYAHDFRPHYSTVPPSRDCRSLVCT
jgi:hypothetical protein